MAGNCTKVIIPTATQPQTQPATGSSNVDPSYSRPPQSVESAPIWPLTKQSRSAPPRSDSPPPTHSHHPFEDAGARGGPPARPRPLHTDQTPRFKCAKRRRRVPSRVPGRPQIETEKKARAAPQTGIAASPANHVSPNRGATGVPGRSGRLSDVPNARTGNAGVENERVRAENRRPELPQVANYSIFGKTGEGRSMERGTSGD